MGICFSEPKSAAPAHASDEQRAKVLAAAEARIQSKKPKSKRPSASSEIAMTEITPQRQPPPLRRTDTEIPAHGDVVAASDVSVDVDGATNDPEIPTLTNSSANEANGETKLSAIRRERASRPGSMENEYAGAFGSATMSTRE